MVVELPLLPLLLPLELPEPMLPLEPLLEPELGEAGDVLLGEAGEVLLLPLVPPLAAPLLDLLK